jgi:large subunit ribosomal protein L2
MVGNCISLTNIPIGTWVHNIEWNPGQGAKLIRAAGTFVKIIKKFEILNVLNHGCDVYYSFK